MITEGPLIYKPPLVGSLVGYLFAALFMVVGVVSTVALAEFNIISSIFIMFSAVILLILLHSLGARLVLTDHGISQRGVFLRNWEIPWNQVSEWSLTIGDNKYFITLKSSLDHKEYSVDDWFKNNGWRRCRKGRYAPLVETINRYCGEPKIVFR